MQSISKLSFFPVRLFPPMAVLARLTSPQGSGPSWQVTHFCSRILQRDNVREWSLEETFVAGKQAGDVARVLVEECHLPVSPKYSSISICQVLSSYFNTKIQLPSSFAPVPTSPLFNFFAVSFRGKEMSLSRCIGLYYKLPKSDPYAVY